MYRLARPSLLTTDGVLYSVGPLRRPEALCAELDSGSERHYLMDGPDKIRIAQNLPSEL